MAIVPAKCTSCGGTLKVREEDKTAICPYCGTEYLVQEAIEQYNITNVYNIQKASLKVDHRQLFADRIEAAEKQLRLLKDYSKALGAFMALENDVPEEFRIWSGKLEARTGGYDVATVCNMHFFDNNYLDQLVRDYDNAYTTGDNEQKEEINQKFIKLLKQSYENIGLAENVLKNNMKKRQKYRDISNVLGRIGAIIFILTIILAGLALLVVGFLALVVLVDISGEVIAEALVVAAIAFAPAIITLIPVIILMSLSKKSDKKDEEISNGTARIIKGELRLDIPGFTPMGEYYELQMLCHLKAVKLRAVIDKKSLG